MTPLPRHPLTGDEPPEMIALLEQWEVWQPKAGPMLSLEEMSNGHLRNLQRWLRRRAHTLKFYYEFQALGWMGWVSGDQAEWDAEHAYETLLEMGDLEWLRRTALYRAITIERWARRTGRVGRFDRMIAFRESAGYGR